VRLSGNGEWCRSNSYGQAQSIQCHLHIVYLMMASFISFIVEYNFGKIQAVLAMQTAVTWELFLTKYSALRSLRRGLHCASQYPRNQRNNAHLAHQIGGTLNSWIGQLQIQRLHGPTLCSANILDKLDCDQVTIEWANSTTEANLQIPIDAALI